MNEKPGGYTLPAIPEHVERELKRRSNDERKEIGTVIVESLERGLGLRGDIHTDLDFLIGSWEEDAGFEEAVKAFEQIDQGFWR